ncbi:uncharacterized protein LOC112467461 [Temnothorax curvispinosus]|uniref:Uncharacterized protein LOC112467461 n=1 Tax=Temnothorax curvispinosus TaxID=300111 RepID=A0A6J1RC92_9HYME|nr:uncharacterized protein LOC112467461 [Temnothorax curvispinosus]
MVNVCVNEAMDRARRPLQVIVDINDEDIIFSSRPTDKEGMEEFPQPLSENEVPSTSKKDVQNSIAEDLTQQRINEQEHVESQINDEKNGCRAEHSNEPQKNETVESESESMATTIPFGQECDDTQSYEEADNETQSKLNNNCQVEQPTTNQAPIENLVGAEHFKPIWQDERNQDRTTTKKATPTGMRGKVAMTEQREMKASVTTDESHRRICVKFRQESSKWITVQGVSQRKAARTAQMVNQDILEEEEEEKKERRASKRKPREKKQQVTAKAAIPTKGARKDVGKINPKVIITRLDDGRIIEERVDDEGTEARTGDHDSDAKKSQPAIMPNPAI